MPRINTPAPAIHGDIIRLTLLYGAHGQRYMTVLDYQSLHLGEVGFSDLIAFYAAWKTANETNFLNILPPTTSHTGALVAVVSNANVPTYVNSAALAGTSGVNSQPEEMYALAIKRAPLKGQHGLGQVRWPTVPDIFVTPATDPNRLNVAALALYGTLHLGLETPVTFGALAAGLCITTRPTPVSPLVSQAIDGVALYIQPLLHSLDRRREGKGI